MDRLQDRRIWLAGGALAALLILAVGWLAFIGPKFADAKQLRQDAASTQQQNGALAAQVGTLNSKSKHLTVFTARLRRALEALPPDSGLPTFTREVSGHAAAAGVAVSSVAVGPVVSAAPQNTTPTAATPSAATTSSAPATGATSAAAQPATGTSPATTIAIPITLTTTGSVARQQVFLQRLRLVGPRSVLVGSAIFAPTSTSKSIEGKSVLTTTLTVFSAPQTPAQIAALNKLLNGKIGN